MYRPKIKRYYSVRILQRNGISVPLDADPEMVVNILAAVLAREQGIAIDYCLKKFNLEIRAAVACQKQE
jgi:hypothetical protein